MRGEKTRNNDFFLGGAGESPNKLMAMRIIRRGDQTEHALTGARVAIVGFEERHQSVRILPHEWRNSILDLQSLASLFSTAATSCQLTRHIRL